MKNLGTKVSLAIVSVASVVLGFAGVSFADTVAPLPADPTNGAMASGTNSVRTWVTTYGIPVMIIVIVFSVLIGAGFRWLKRGASAAAKPKG